MMANVGSHVFHRDPTHGRAMIVSGEGCWLTDADGKRYIDGSSGAAVSNIGHGSPTVARAIARQAEDLEFAHTLFFDNPAQAELAHLLAEASGGHLARSMFFSSGSEAVESALKVARQYHVERGEARRSVVIAREQAYHGNTLGALSLSGDLKRRALFEPYLPTFRKVPPVFPFHRMREDETIDAYRDRCVADLRSAIEEEGGDRIAAMIVEPVAGSTLGSATAPSGYFAAVRELCDAHGIVLIFDEVFCGIGRTGTFFAYEQEGCRPDIVINAKGLSGGFQPLSSVSTTEAIYAAIAEGTGRLATSQTWMGHPIACAAGVEVVGHLLSSGLVNEIGPKGAVLEGLLRDTLADCPGVGDIRGRGMLWAVELLESRAERRPYDPGLKLYERIRLKAMENGLICWPVGGCADGTRGDHIMIAPPFVASVDDLREIATRLRATIADVIGAL